jgi:hypothetical protein
MVYFRYTNINTPHNGDNKDDVAAADDYDNSNNYL